MTADDWKALVTELVRIDDAMESGTQHFSNQGQALDGFSALAHFRNLAKRARNSLSQLKMAGPTYEEVEAWADQQGFIKGSGDHPCGFWINDGDVGALALAVLERWGNHSVVVPIPVSDRLPEEKDCMVHPRTKLGQWCWGFERCEVSLARPAKWRLMHMETVELEASHWLPHYSLPIPQDTEQP